MHVLPSTWPASLDLADPAMNAMLLAHLHTTDFFDVEHHPTADGKDEG